MPCIHEVPNEDSLNSYVTHWKWKWKLLSRVWLFVTQGLYSPWNSPGQNTGVGSLSLLPGIFPTQGLDPGLPHCRQILYQLSHKGSPRILEWVAYPFSSGSSWPRNQTRFSCIAGGFFTNWAIREAHVIKKAQNINPPCHSHWVSRLIHNFIYSTAIKYPVLSVKLLTIQLLSSSCN